MNHCGARRRYTSKLLPLVALVCLLSDMGGAAQVREVRRVLIFNEIGLASASLASTDQQTRAFIYDSRALRRWGLNTEKLSHESVILYRQLSLWEIYKHYIISGPLTPLLQGLLILGLLIERMKRKRTERALRESEQRFRTMADGAPVLMWISGLDKRCTDFNRGWLDFTGRLIEQELGDGWIESVHSEDLERCLAIYTDAFDARRSFTMEYRLRRYDGQYRWIIDTGTPRLLPDGTFAGYIGSCIDINDQKTGELARQEVAGRLINAQEVERARISRELHDSIGQSIALLTMQLPVSEDSYSQHLGQRRLNLQELRGKLIDLGTQVSHLSHQIHSSELDYLGLLGAIEGLCAEFSEQHSVEVECICSEVSAGLDAAVALGLFRVTQEALHNIAKHSKAKLIHVSLTAEEANLSLTIQDDGIGFRVGHNGIHQPGLGLISMRERIHLMRGDLVIRSSPGEGTTIAAKVPIAATE